MIQHEKILFKEEQQFRESWLWSVILISLLGSLGAVIYSGYSENKISDKSFLIGLISIVLFEAIFVTLMFITALETKVTNEGIYFKWFPFRKKFSRIDKNEIELFEIRNTPALQRGFKIVPGYGKVHVVNGGKGMQFKLKSDKKIFIGTKETFLFKKAIDNLLNQV